MVILGHLMLALFGWACTIHTLSLVFVGSWVLVATVSTALVLQLLAHLSSDSFLCCVCPSSMRYFFPVCNMYFSSLFWCWQRCSLRVVSSLVKRCPLRFIIPGSAMYGFFMAPDVYKPATLYRWILRPSLLGHCHVLLPGCFFSQGSYAEGLVGPWLMREVVSSAMVLPTLRCLRV
jgi:hypothetical protein